MILDESVIKHFLHCGVFFKLRNVVQRLEQINKTTKKKLPAKI